MAKVSLRIYNREIESMVDGGQLDEAIAHCRHILNTFPKHLETYRMIGKAYLEAKRYDEATEIFERVLMAVPDDFVAHVGMSIIRDEQKNMDAAIWHMQRAFEVQPSNSAIQAELQRLYGSRDGVEPPKIRLTRGALAHMYVQGELYPQAIAEIEGVLDDDRDRHDMQVLLALAYFRGGHKSEAAEMCSQLLRRYPYCFDANRVLVELLPQTEQGESVQTYRKRINELDPYIAFVTGSVFHTDEVPDAAVSLERLEWDGQPVDMGPEWGASMGIGLGEIPAAGDEEPDWLKSAMTTGSPGDSTGEEPASVSEGLPIPTPSAGGDDDIPEFLRAAGWSEDTGTFQEGHFSFDDSDESSEDLPLAEGDLPDWIKAMDPTGGAGEASFPQAEYEEDLTQDDVPDWLQGIGEAQSGTSDEQPVAEGELPDWLEAAKPAEEPASEQEPQEQPMAEPTRDEDIPDWLKDRRPEGEETTTPEWYQEPTGETPQESAGESATMSEESLSDWQIGDEGTDEGPVDFDKVDTGELGTSAAEQDDAIAWLESLASKHGAKPEELVTDPNARSEAEPEWVQKAKATKDQQIEGEQAEPSAEAPAEMPEFLSKESVSQEEEPTPDLGTLVSQEQSSVEAPADLPDFLAERDVEQPVEESAASIDELGTSAQEQDDAVAWLESLASKHGAKPEELVTDPEARKETAPEWVQKASEASEEHGQGERPTAPPPEELEGLAESILGEQADVGVDAEIEKMLAEESIPSSETDETGMWLQELAEQDSVSEIEETTAEAKTPAMEGDIPDWLREMEGDTTQTEATSTSADEAPPLPDWLSDMDTGPSEAEGFPEPSPEEALPEPGPEGVGKININTASVEELAELPGIGDLLAQNIIAHREAYGDFSSVDDLENIAGVGPATIEELRDQVEIEPQPDITDWLQTVAEEESAETVAEEASDLAADESTGDDLPSWLAGLDQEKEQAQSVAGSEDDLPEWLRTEAGGDFTQPEPTAPTDWQPAETRTSQEEPPAPEPEPEARIEEIEAALEPEPEAESETEEPPVQSAPSPEPGFKVEEPAAETTPLSAAEPELEPEIPPEQPTYQEPVTRSRTGMTGVLSAVQDPGLTEAQSELTRGNIPGAMESYGKLIKKGKLLEEIIFDLREALYRYPVEVIIMQTLGDAYMRANRLQEALDSYTKAEELLR